MVEEDELFNAEYTEVERVLAESRIPSPEDSPDEPESIHYLVKWRQLPYEDATWELEQDVDRVKIEQYTRLLEQPGPCQVSPLIVLLHRALGHPIE